MESDEWQIAVVEDNAHPQGFQIGRAGRHFVLLLRSASWRIRALSPCCMAYISLNRDTVVCEDCLQQPGLAQDDCSISSWTDRPLTAWLAQFGAWAEWWEPLEAEIKGLDLAVLLKSMVALGLSSLATDPTNAYPDFSRLALYTRDALQADLP